MKPIFVGNVEYDSRQSDIERLFKRYGKVDRVDMKTGFAFVYMDDERDAEDAIRKLDRIEFGRKRRPLRVEWTKQERDNKRMGDSKKPAANTKLSKTLFVINFDPVHTRTRDLEKHFDPHGKIVNIRIRRNFAFIQFETQEDATRALEATHMSMLIDRDITVEYALRDDDERRPGSNPDRRGRDISPAGRSNDRRRSPSPYRRDRGSPDYGRGSNPVARHERRASPRYDRAETPINGRGSSPVSRYERRTSPKYVSADSPVNARGSNPASRYERRGSPVNGRGSSPVSRYERRGSPVNGRGLSPVSRYERRASPVNGRYHSASPPPRGRSRS